MSTNYWLTGWARYLATSTETASTIGQSDQTFEDTVSLRAELIVAKSQISEMILEMRDKLLARRVLPPTPVTPHVPDQGSAPTSYYCCFYWIIMFYCTFYYVTLLRYLLSIITVYLTIIFIIRWLYIYFISCFIKFNFLI